MSKFNVGDVVRVKEVENCDAGLFSVGDVGCITEDRRGSFVIVDFAGRGNTSVTHDGKWAVCQWQLELVTPA